MSSPASSWSRMTAWAASLNASSCSTSLKATLTSRPLRLLVVPPRPRVGAHHRGRQNGVDDLFRHLILLSRIYSWFTDTSPLTPPVPRLAASAGARRRAWPSAAAPGAPAPGRARARTRINTPIVISAYSVGWWNSGRTLSISVRKSAASSAPTKRPAAPGEAGAPEHGRRRCFRATRSPGSGCRSGPPRRGRSRRSTPVRSRRRRQDHDPGGPDPDPARGRLVEADRTQRHPGPGAVEPDVAEQREGDDPDERDRNEAPARRQLVDGVARLGPRDDHAARTTHR